MKYVRAAVNDSDHGVDVNDFDESPGKRTNNNSSCNNNSNVN